ncbi:MAG: hypothetical protein JNL25_05760 [Rhodospirillaceae bacterium]|nr:hypothetical protein [Rhodospirillaceae bacterium]
MSDFLNPLGGRFIGLTSPVAPSSISGTIPDPPRGFRLLDPGTIIKGVVMGRESDGLVTIATDKGTIRVASNATLPPGTHVTLEVRPAGDRLQVLILANDAARPPPSPGGSNASPPAAGANAAPSPPPPAGTGVGNAPPQPGPAAPPSGSATTGTPSTGQTGNPAGGTQAPSAPSPGTPASGTQPPPAQTLPPIQVIGSTLRAIVLHPQPLQSQALPPQGLQAQGLQVQSGTGQSIPPQAGPAAGAVPVVSGSPPLPPPQVVPTAPGAPVVPPGSASAHPPAPLPTAPAAPSIAVVTSPVESAPAASALSAEARQRILALFAQVGDIGTASGSGKTLLPADAAGRGGQIQASLAQAHPSQPPLPLGAALQLRVLAVQIGAQHAIEIDPAAQIRAGGKDSHIVFGRVIAVTPAGHPVIHTPAGDILLQQRSSLPVGAQLALALDQVELAPPVGGAVAPPPVQTPQQALLSLARGWPTLADLIAILQGSAPHAAGKAGGALDPTLARQILAQLPQVGPRLAAGLLGAMAALRSGDLGRLLGPLLARGLGPEREEMMRRLRTEFTQLSALAQERPEGEWRALFLPLLDEHQRVQRINLFYRQHRKGDGEEFDPEAGTRFVVEAEFSRLGPFQLDGLMRQQRFDLMIRSRQRLDERMRRDIEAIYEEARGITGFAGLIAFQTVEEFPVSPLEEMKRDSAHLTA